MTLLRRLLVVLSLLAGIALTWGAAWVGLTLATTPTYRYSKRSAARFRVKAASDAATQYMLDNASGCPRGIDQLVAQNYLDRSNAKDPWGRELIFHCPGSGDAPSADVSSTGPDKEEGTPDDIRSWELYTPAVSPLPAIGRARGVHRIP